MKRGMTGRYQKSTAGGEAVKAFIPRPLPPTPPLRFDGAVQRAFEPALLSLGRLDAVVALLPDRSLFLYSYVRKEAVLSSQIEGTQSSLSDLLLFELDEIGAPPGNDDVVETANYVAAINHGISRMRDGFPLSGRLLRELHGILLRSGRGSTNDPGEFRRTQNWIGGTRPGNAAFVPPPPTEVADAVGSLEKFIHGQPDDISQLVRAALAHVQFETIHPFLDGNGRVGRLLITLQLCHARVLREPILYLSLYLKEHRDEYYRLLTEVRTTGDWEAWLVFFLEGIAETATEGVITAERLNALFERDRARLLPIKRRGRSALQLLEALKRTPMLSISRAADAAEMSFPSASAALELLGEMGMVDEVTGRVRNRVYAYREYLAVLNEKTVVG
jgi:Fic family protein